MKRIASITVFALLFSLLTAILEVQGQGTSSADIGNKKDVTLEESKNGFFFITPFYQFTKFKELELTSHTSKHTHAEGVTTITDDSEEINDYNDVFDTEYHNSMSGLKIGYQMRNGFGLSGYVGLDHYQLKTYIAPNNGQQVGSDMPAITLGSSVSYKTVVYDKLTVMAMVDFNFSKSNSEDVDNNTLFDISSSYFHSFYWDANLVLGYPIGSFIPYAGIGFTELYVKTIHEEQFTTDEDGVEFLEKAEFDADYKGSSFYGFAGVEYLINQNLSVYLRSSFINPVRATIGFRIMI